MDSTAVVRSREPLWRSFRRLALIIKLILRAFMPKPTLIQQQELQAAAKKPSMLELSTSSNKRKLSERIHQRLLLRSPALDDTVIPISGAVPPSSVLSYEIQNLLVTPPWNRSSEQVEKAVEELQLCCQSFGDFPTPVQKSICKLGWYQLVEPSRVIYTAGYDPMCYYLLLVGSVIEVDGNVQSTTGNASYVHDTGSSFGDSAIIDGTRRVTSCYAKDQVELLAISRSDYIDLSLRQTRKSYQNNKHFMFCRTISLLKEWPLDELSTENCAQCYYKPATIVVKDSKKSDYIYIVMSGSCNVIKRFIDNTALQSKAHQRSLTSDVVAVKSPLSTQFLSQNRKMEGEEGIVENEERKTRDRRATHPIYQEENDLEKPKGKPILIQLQILNPKDIFGLSTILYEDEPSVSLPFWVTFSVHRHMLNDKEGQLLQVSNGCECVLIAKDFILTHMGERTRTWLYKQIQAFPSQEMMLKRIKEHQNWNIYKQTLVSHLKKKHT